MRVSILAAGALAASTMVLSGSTARAEGATFGKAGQLGVSWDQPLVAGALVATNASFNGGATLPTTLTPVGFQYASVSNNGGSYTAFSIAPAADYFVIDGLSVGAQVLFGLVSTSPPSQPNVTVQGSTTTLYGIAPQVGYNLSLTDSISFWPKVFFAFAGSSVNNNGGSQSSGTLGLFAPFLFHIATHIYAGVGPDVSTQVTVSQTAQGGMNVPNPPKLTTFGAMATFGGWFQLGGG